MIAQSSRGLLAIGPTSTEQLLTNIFENPLERIRRRQGEVWCSTTVREVEEATQAGCVANAILKEHACAQWRAITSNLHSLCRNTREPNLHWRLN
jgi:hypothetical protein